MNALAANISFLGSLATTPEETVGLLHLFGPRMERLFNEVKIADHQDAIAAVRAYCDLLPIDASLVEPPRGRIVNLLVRCQGLLESLR
jgi:hypothetical protein